MCSIKSFSLAFVAAAMLCSSARADERYYMLMFGSQSEPFAFRYTHTFALFVKASDFGKTRQAKKLETQTISWMPKSLAIRVLARQPEPGINLSLAETIGWAQSVGAETTMWGPFEIEKELYDMASAQAALLNSNAIEYLCIDRRFRGEGASNCLHAVADLDKAQPPLSTGTQCGFAGSELALQHLGRNIVPSKASNRWLCERLKLSPKEIRFAGTEVRTQAETAQSLPTFSFLRD